MSVSLRSVPPPASAPRSPVRLQGDPGRPLTTSRGMSRMARQGLALLLIVWFALPLVPLVLWGLAEQWSFPARLPTEWGLGGVSSALAAGGAEAFARSLTLGLTVATIATPLGAVAARGLVNGWAPMPRTLTALLFSPLLIPAFVAALGTNILLLRAHVPPVMGLVLVLVAMAVPYTAFVLRTAYAAHDVGYEEEARTLGASRRRVLWQVHIPLLTPALARAAFLAFLVGWSDYIVTVFVGGGQVVTLPLVTASAASGVGNDAVVAVLSLAAILPPVVLLAVLANSRWRTEGAV
ncbi:ABC transporter permease [Demequina flava]|uniref:ABC transporter permease n=1 Tax=Demequina flava TaxID=1095025 RepID=UPI0009E573BC|nr:ABC transporter permease subunit [Demequina flava]